MTRSRCQFICSNELSQLQDFAFFLFHFFLLHHTVAYIVTLFLTILSGQGDFAAAIVYAANNGANIANCSWGWATPDYYEQDVLDAIDYFIAMNRGNNVSGGVMFFATGNDGATGNMYPACYEKVVAVGSMTDDFTIAS